MFYYQNRFFFSPPPLGKWVYAWVDNQWVSIAISNTHTTLSITLGMIKQQPLKDLAMAKRQVHPRP